MKLVVELWSGISDTTEVRTAHNGLPEVTSCKEMMESCVKRQSSLDCLQQLFCRQSDESSHACMFSPEPFARVELNDIIRSSGQGSSFRTVEDVGLCFIILNETRMLSLDLFHLRLMQFLKSDTPGILSPHLKRYKINRQRRS
ncbi:hypothetical protein J6590_020139 [Homalodisca vitripennis]|nr:hypothetical protein J6590_020139 [Homalodisca vitripennis]